jgi:hypothetical protein
MPNLWPGIKSISMWGVKKFTFTGCTVIKNEVAAGYNAVPVRITTIILLIMMQDRVLHYLFFLPYKNSYRCL